MQVLSQSPSPPRCGARAGLLGLSSPSEIACPLPLLGAGAELRLRKPVVALELLWPLLRASVTPHSPEVRSWSSGVAQGSTALKDVLPPDTSLTPTAVTNQLLSAPVLMLPHHS